jgi:hypothetical protein
MRRGSLGSGEPEGFTGGLTQLPWVPQLAAPGSVNVSGFMNPELFYTIFEVRTLQSLVNSLFYHGFNFSMRWVCEDGAVFASFVQDLNGCLEGRQVGSSP